MNHIIWILSILKYFGVLGFISRVFELNYFDKFMYFWLFGIVEIVLTFPVFLQSMKQIVGIPLIYFKEYLLNNDNNEFEIKYQLPFEGEWTVINGGVTRKTSHSWMILSQRYAYDFLILNEDGKSYRTKNKQLSNFFCFDKNVLAPADGIVVEMKDKYKDSPVLGFGRVDHTITDIRGNYIVIKHSDNQYSVLAHLKYNSIVVKLGDHVKKGEYIARCGNSGNTTEPHLHFQVQNGKSFFFSMGVKILFENILINEENLNQQSKYNALINSEANESCCNIFKGMKVKNKS